MSFPTRARASDGPAGAGLGAGPPRGGGAVRSLVVAVAGGSGSGKSTVVREVVRLLGTDTVSVIQHDAYYRDLSHLPFRERARTNFDHPDSLETELLVRHVSRLVAGEVVEVPTYDFATHTRLEGSRRVPPSPLVVLDGILVLADAGLRSLLDYSVFVHAEPEERLARRIERDTRDRGRSPESVLEQFERFVRPMHDHWVEPSRAHADMTILEGGHNREAVGRLVRTLSGLLSPRAG